MEDFLKYIDVILLGILIVVLLFVFRRLLGKRVGYEKPEVSTNNYPEVVLGNNTKTVDSPEEDKYKYPIGSLMQKLEVITEHDISFSAKTFIESSKKAFEMIVKAYASGSLDGVRDFISEKVYESFYQSSQQRRSEGQTLYVDIKQFMLAEIIDVNIDDNYDTQISVKYVSLQSRELVSGLQSPSMNQKATEIRETWVFAKNIKENTSIWKLVKTY
ncbi:MAG: Tim44/TimA family putative adaptor protein [Alphaproteobacteria bacterium]|nr:Tim44/TimA family putative adaptor protein [Alphaproteobacteria bacterium]